MTTNSRILKEEAVMSTAHALQIKAIGTENSMMAYLTPISASASDVSHQTRFGQGLRIVQPDLSVARESMATTPQVLRVLLLEDNEDLAELIRSCLEMDGHQIAVAHLGQHASRLLNAQPFDLAIVDIDLPDTTGFAVVAQAIAQGKLQNTKILFYSGNHSHEAIVTAGQFPGSRFLRKPFIMSQFFEEIRLLFPDHQTSADRQTISDNPSIPPEEKTL